MVHVLLVDASADTERAQEGSLQRGLEPDQAGAVGPLGILGLQCQAGMHFKREFSAYSFRPTLVLPENSTTIILI